MAMIPKNIGKIVEERVFAALSKEFSEISGTNSDVTAQWRKQAKIHGVAAQAMIEAILATAQVAPGIASAGSPTNHVTVTPGKIQ